MQKALAIPKRILHNIGMRTHRDILDAAGHGDIATLTDRPITTVRSWALRDSIPADMWLTFVEAGHASLEELAASVSRKRPETGKAA